MANEQFLYNAIYGSRDNRGRNTTLVKSFHYFYCGTSLPQGKTASIKRISGLNRTGLLHDRTPCTPIRGFAKTSRAGGCRMIKLAGFHRPLAFRTALAAPPLNATACSLATSAAPSTAEAINTPERLVVIFFLSSGCCTSANERSRFKAVSYSEAGRGRNTPLVKLVP
jgi:hypothetical protein